MVSLTGRKVAKPKQPPKTRSTWHLAEVICGGIQSAIQRVQVRKLESFRSSYVIVKFYFQLFNTCGAQEGALQPVIGLLSSKCAESQREAALLLGQFATTTDDYKAKIVQVCHLYASPHARTVSRESHFEHYPFIHHGV